MVASQPVYRSNGFSLIVVLRPTSDFLQSLLRSDMSMAALIMTKQWASGPSCLRGYPTYCIHQIYALEFLTLAGFEPRPSWTWIGYSNHTTKVLTFWFDMKSFIHPLCKKKKHIKWSFLFKIMPVGSQRSSLTTNTDL